MANIVNCCASLPGVAGYLLPIYLVVNPSESTSLEKYASGPIKSSVNVMSVQVRSAIFASSISALPPLAAGTVKLVIVAFVTVSLAIVALLLTVKFVTIPVNTLFSLTYCVPT